MSRCRKVSQVARASHKAEAAMSRVVESRSGEGVTRGGGAIAGGHGVAIWWASHEEEGGVRERDGELVPLAGAFLSYLRRSVDRR